MNALELGKVTWKTDRPFFPGQEEISNPGKEIRSQLEEVEFRGFGGNLDRWVRDAYVQLGLDLRNLKRVEYKTTERPDLLGQHYLYTGETVLYQNLRKHDKEQWLRTLAHEAVHQLSPALKENSQLYGGELGRETVAMRAEVIADQCMQTGKYLDSYHYNLCKAYSEGRISRWRLNEETNAIMCEQRLFDPKHLVRLEAAQRKELGGGEEYVSVINASEAALIRMIPGVVDTRSLDKHINKLMAWMADNPVPVSNLGQVKVSSAEAMQIRQ